VIALLTCGIPDLKSHNKAVSSSDILEHISRGDSGEALGVKGLFEIRGDKAGLANATVADKNELQAGAVLAGDTGHWNVRIVGFGE
jgi:hypothetical protein